MTLDQLKAKVYDKMVAVEIYQENIRLCQIEIQNLNSQIKATTAPSKLFKQETAAVKR